jgi:hypothetical protein
LTDFGRGLGDGYQCGRCSWTILGEADPVGHHVTNVIVQDASDDARVISKGIAVMGDGTAGSVVSEDVVERRNGEWRICARKVTSRRRPLES